MLHVLQLNSLQLNNLVWILHFHFVAQFMAASLQLDKREKNKKQTELISHDILMVLFCSFIIYNLFYFNGGSLNEFS